MPEESNITPTNSDQDNLRDELMTLTIPELIDLTLDLHKCYVTTLTQLNEMPNHFLIKKSELIDLTLDLHKRYVTSLTQLNDCRKSTE